nr:AI-2E family transporter [Evansella tamaricis]
MLFLIGSYMRPVFEIVLRVIVPFFVAGLIAYILHPIIKKMENKKVPRSLSILLIYTLFVLLFIWVLFKGTPYILLEGQELLEQLPYMAETYGTFVNTIHEKAEVLPETFQDRAEEWLLSGEAYMAETLTKIGAFIRQLVDWMFILVVIPFLVFYLLKDMELVKKLCWYITPKPYRKEGERLIKEIDESLGNYIRGQLLVCVAVGIFAYIGFILIDMPYALLLAVFIGLTNVIPYFGPIIGVVPVIFIALTESLQLVVMAIIVTLIVQVIEGNLLAPIIVGKSLHMHPALIIFALVVGGEVAGVIGLILSVPILTVIRVILVHVRRMIRERKGFYY